MMKYLYPHIRSTRLSLVALLPLLTLFLTTACSTEDESMDRTSVKMTFTTKAASAANGTSNLTDRERMRTLRVIMAREGRILFNVSYTLAKGETGKTIHFNDLPVPDVGADFDIYAIANEASVRGTDNWEGKEVDLDALYNKVIDVDFNAEGNASLPIPQTAKTDIKVERDIPNQSYTVPLEFPVAKVCVNFTNHLEAEQTVTDIKLPGMKVGSGYLFPRDMETNSTGTTDLALTPDPLVITGTPYGSTAPEKKEMKAYYVYPVKADAYKLTAKWPQGQAKEVDLNQGGILTDGLKGNTQLNVSIGLKYGVLHLENITAEVEAWTAKDIFPEFN